MIEAIARKSTTGEIFINLARTHLRRNEWGRARIALEEGLSKGCLNNLDEAKEMQKDIYIRLGVKLGSSMC